MGLSKILAFCLLGLASAAATAASSSPRDVVSFDFGWKHRPGLHDWADPDAPPPANPDPGAAPKEAAPAYKDGDWKSVQLPHDGLISFQASEKACPDGCSGRSYIPRHVLWYRKKFTIPKTWDGSAYWLDFAGSFRETTVWVNGVLSAKHVCGYTPFRLRLDNITAVKVGEETTVAVFVDPDNGDTGGQDHGSGWWYEGGGESRVSSISKLAAPPLSIVHTGAGNTRPPPHFENMIATTITHGNIFVLSLPHHLPLTPLLLPHAPPLTRPLPRGQPGPRQPAPHRAGRPLRVQQPDRGQEQPPCRGVHHPAVAADGRLGRRPRQGDGRQHGHRTDLGVRHLRADGS